MVKTILFLSIFKEKVKKKFLYMRKYDYTTLSSLTSWLLKLIMIIIYWGSNKEKEDHESYTRGKTGKCHYYFNVDSRKQTRNKQTGGLIIRAYHSRKRLVLLCDQFTIIWDFPLKEPRFFFSFFSFHPLFSIYIKV